MQLRFLQVRLIDKLTRVLILISLSSALVDVQVKNTQNPPACEIVPVNYKGWQAHQISNRWVQLIVVPQNGGRLMQVTFGGHSYLFVNPKYAGKYFPPTVGKW